jgi:copper chaperone CopZ
MTDSVIYNVRGMTCSGCQRALLAALKRAGAKVALDDISVTQGTLKVSDGTSEAAIRAAIADAGFQVSTPGQD